MKIEPYLGWKIIKSIDGLSHHVPTKLWLQEAEEKYQKALQNGKDNRNISRVLSVIVGILATLLLRCVL